MHPGDSSVRLADLGRGYVAGGTEPDGPNRPVMAVRAGENDQAIGQNRRGNGVITSSTQPPPFLAGIQVISPAMAIAVDNHLEPSVFHLDGGCAPGAHLVARHAPKLPAILDAEGGEILLAHH